MDIYPVQPYRDGTDTSGEAPAGIIAKQESEYSLTVMLFKHKPILGQQLPSDTPNLYIQRRPAGWMICIHSNGDDPIGYLQIADDGRACLMRDSFTDASPLTIPPPGDDGLDLEGSHELAT